MISTAADSQFPGIRTRVQDFTGNRETPTSADVRVAAKDFRFWYGFNHVLRNISMDMYTRHVTAIIGPSGCGKSTFLRSLNRMNDMIANIRMEGAIMIDGQNIISPEVDVVTLRRNVGMVFQHPNPFPKSIFDNIAYGLRINGITNSAAELAGRVEEALRQAAIWDEVKDRLHKSALSMSGGEQQRLCIARALAVRPEILLMDEPASSLDPISTAKIEDLIFRLKQNYTIVIVTHNMQQAARVSDYTAFFLQGELIEFSPTVQIFTTPRDQRTEDYITGRFG
ncbi:MAG TPA: phosphate ABC transporter ATP-binding protein PstB [Acidobacteriota bacterium]|nr:phosphate ABC transporter ATP-binding protein PstB [Acidobacteriota bacterium]